MKKNIVQEKSYEFAKKIVKFYMYASKKYNEYTLTKQLLRSWTSIWANISESVSSESWKDFLHKLSIAYKEASETKYRLSLLKDTEIFIDDSKSIEILYLEIDEIVRLLSSITKTLKWKKTSNNW